MSWPHVYLTILAIVYFTVLFKRKNGEKIKFKPYLSGIMTIILVVFITSFISLENNLIITSILFVFLPLAALLFCKMRDKKYDRYVEVSAYIFLLSIFSMCF
ncbi:hypothetical protein SPSPH_047250 (plasmid) [Sporomusa sphaeroides DSM 2875]|uniref:Uncharacterized protein n=1 Tax=Sporomusa sphaeroides DSM 2875 TaxID=1337886 RepID=A0A1U7M9R6_9FIRM|nr:hypothetical protein SPSPH_45460 [Sporomusa sphaeroides DSM 2875]CVK21530.1 hypothetical protein SSPH_04222 [Sporomusa sphaeroides DSM 2875]